MKQFHHSRLSGQPQMISSVEEKGLFRAIMRPFEVLHRQHWSAPWEAEKRKPGIRH